MQPLCFLAIYQRLTSLRDSTRLAQWAIISTAFPVACTRAQKGIWKIRRFPTLFRKLVPVFPDRLHVSAGVQGFYPCTHLLHLFGHCSPMHFRAYQMVIWMDCCWVFDNGQVFAANIVESPWPEDVQLLEKKGARVNGCLACFLVIQWLWFF